MSPAASCSSSGPCGGGAPDGWGFFYWSPRRALCLLRRALAHCGARCGRLRRAPVTGRRDLVWSLCAAKGRESGQDLRPCPADKLICGATPHKIAPTTTFGAPLSCSGRASTWARARLHCASGAPPLWLWARLAPLSVISPLYFGSSGGAQVAHRFLSVACRSLIGPGLPSRRAFGWARLALPRPSPTAPSSLRGPSGLSRRRGRPWSSSRWLCRAVVLAMSVAWGGCHRSTPALALGRGW
ncbi:hypothetical protein SAMN05661093_09663 [Kibdelosporangium aridum]|uniref:Uncharacterized protein n=1 Tax=Kibdelosporangium aridum TaxID=2030 RepID=A0A1W2FW31_KIBAR|nr:hypothetical protein SAMN05661093_09663 [Kibdelosporangium aridum]